MLLLGFCTPLALHRAHSGVLRQVDGPHCWLVIQSLFQVVLIHSLHSFPRRPQLVHVLIFQAACEAGTFSCSPSALHRVLCCVLSPQSCSTLCNPMDYTVQGILQARILEWVAFPFSRGSSQPRDRTQVSHIAGGFFTSWAIREALFLCRYPMNRVEFSNGFLV